MIDGPIPEGLTFDDVLLLPGKSSVLPTQADTRTCLSRKIALNIPDRGRGDGHRHRIAPGHRHRAAGRHRVRSSQHDHRAAGRRSGPGEALGKRNDRRSGDDRAGDVRAPGARHHEQVQSLRPAGDARRSAWWAS